jgi:hypothetical protein
MVAVAGELAIAAGVVGWPAGASEAAASTLFADWLGDRGGTAASEDRNIAVALRRFIMLHGSSRFAPLREPSEADEGAQVEPPLKDAADPTVNRAGWRWQENSAAGERIWIHAIMTDIFDAEIAGPLGMEPGDARARLGKAKLIRELETGGKTRWSGKFKRIPGVGRPQLVVVEPLALGGG